MTDIPWGEIPANIEAALRAYGPMTLPELVLHVPGTPNDIRKALERMRKPSKRITPVGKKRVHIHGWTRDAEGVRPYPRAIYALGHGEDAPPMRRKSVKQVKAEWWARQSARTRKNFVFHLGGV
ncbi:MAG: hypothetical protein ACKOW0_00675 [Schleiferiaceae bacterium]